VMIVYCTEYLVYFGNI